MRAHPAFAAALSASLIACMAREPGPERFVARLRDGGPPRELWLSETGLYADLAARRVAPELRPFSPAFPLWTDGAAKRRWLYLPQSTAVDETDMDHWRFPIGTVAYKEFARAGEPLETRVIARLDRERFFMGAFVWTADGRDARYTPDGERDVRGTGHDVPSSTQCGTCHNGEPGKLLGYSAVQTRYAPPGDATAQAALGYLHGNCAHCHNASGSARPDTDMDLRLSVNDRAPRDTAAYRTTVGRALRSFVHAPLHQRAVAGDPGASAILARMSSRDPRTQMPPLGTEHVDRDGVSAVRAWIAGLDPEPSAR